VGLPGRYFNGMLVTENTLDGKSTTGGRKLTNNGQGLTGKESSKNKLDKIFVQVWVRFGRCD
jgi:hypothetical protein